VILKLESLSKAFGSVVVADRIDLDIEDGAALGIIGPNGAGKSSLFNLIAGSLKPDSGVIRLAGGDVTSEPPQARARSGIARSFQIPQPFANLTVFENLLVGAYAPSAWKARSPAVQEMMEIFPILKERQAQLAGTLSGGEQQMCAIARAMVSRPKVLLLDEPSLGLAPVIVEKIFEVVQAINRKGVTILLVEQNAHVALQIAHRGYVIETGRVVTEGPASGLLQDEHIKQAYLGL